MKLYRILVPVRDIDAGTPSTAPCSRHRASGSVYGIDPWGNHIVFVATGTEFTGGRFVR